MTGDRHVEIDLSAVAGNVAVIRSRVPGPDLMAVVKQDGYGHGAVACARAALAAGATWLGVAHAAEALALRRAGLAAPVLVLVAVPGEDHEACIANEIDVAAGSLVMLDRLAAAARKAGRPARVQLKADTGLSRGGATARDWPALVGAALAGQAAGSFEVTALWSHFACADLPGHPSIASQLDAFGAMTGLARDRGLRPPLRHIANTAAALTRPESWLDLVRIGGGLYGLSTLPGGAPSWLRPALRLSARLAAVKRVPAGTGVSYGLRYVTARETTLGLVPLGYADGIGRSAAGKALVSWKGRRFPVAGTVCMDQFVADFGDEPVRAGDEVLLIGPGDDGEPTAQEWGEALDTISYEIVTGIGPRAGTVVINDNDGTVSQRGS